MSFRDEPPEVNDTYLDDYCEDAFMEREELWELVRQFCVQEISDAAFLKRIASIREHALEIAWGRILNPKDY